MDCVSDISHFRDLPVSRSIPAGKHIARSIEICLTLASTNYFGRSRCCLLPLPPPARAVTSETMSSGKAVKPVKEKEKPRLALEARLKLPPLPLSSQSTFMCPLRVLLRWCPPFAAGEDPTSFFPTLDFLDKLGPPLASATGMDSADAVGLRVGGGRGGAISSWSDLVLAIPPAAESISRHLNSSVHRI
ncbi:hypothetical protein BHE74_00055220 [Ensete ventricosum]|nr:hypothetical protein BHE74_00055220 [Ensete ventricosum]